MSERYYITGVQLGLLMLVIEGTLPSGEGFNILKNIEDDQFIGNIWEKADRILILDSKDRYWLKKTIDDLKNFLENKNVD